MNAHPEEKRLLELAHQAAERAYAPYSRFQVGAAILLADGRVFTGCNVENASYGLTNCAERTAIFTAVAAGPGKPEIVAVAVVNASDAHCPPCGACRQVLGEFARPETAVVYQGAAGLSRTTMGEFLPDCFHL